MVLWDIMVVNNWQIFIEAYVSVTSEWHRLYFIFWWVLCTVITLNMCISLILDVSTNLPEFSKTVKIKNDTLLLIRDSSLF